ncbi:MAG: nucleoside triphosphate pyrophosphohydrolase [Pseudonocardiales bacterium]|nr:MAG: nucleoside triphosphate pyrophosphohydrolase [Pseudonocardiales bacterium]
MTDRLILVATSPRLPAGLLSWPAWQVLRSARVYAGADSAQLAAVRASGIEVTVLAGDPPEQAREFRDRARDGGAAVWLGAPDGDPQFARAVGNLVARESGQAELELVHGSWDPPGAALLGAVEVMDRLRSPGGCPWDAEQTHASLMPYLLEEAYEAYAALEDDDTDALQEELGDVLLQVLFHARLADELPEGERWNIDDVAATLVAKLIRRHPHVFGDTTVSGAAEVHANWDVIKVAEKARTSVTDGVPLGQPALTLAATLLRKADNAGLAVEWPAGADLGERLLALVAEARGAGLDPEVELRRVARELRDRIVVAERAERDDK